MAKRRKLRPAQKAEMLVAACESINSLMIASRVHMSLTDKQYTAHREDIIQAIQTIFDE